MADEAEVMVREVVDVVDPLTRPAALVVSEHGPDCGCTRCGGFQPGNDLSVRHSAYATALRLSKNPRVAQLADAIRATQPIVHPADEGAIWRLALVYRRLELSAAALETADEMPVLGVAGLGGYTDSGKWMGRLRDDHDRWMARASKLESELARTPSSRGKLGLHIAQGRRALSLVELHEAAASETDGAA